MAHAPQLKIAPLATAGVITALLAAPADAPGQARWRLSEEPTLVVGSIDGPRAETFHQIRGVVTATHGMIVVADGGSNELRVFSAAGDFLRSFGSAGDGPREFRGIAWIDRCGGDAIVAYDGLRHRITEWDTDGSLLDEFFVEGPRGDLPPYHVACGPSGKFAVIGWPDLRGSIPPGPYRPVAPLGIADERGRRERFIGEFPALERMRLQGGDRPHPFGRSTHVRMGAGAVYVGTADSFAIQRIAADGARRTFGRDRSIVPLSREMLEAWVDRYLERAPPEQRPALRRSLLDSEWSEWIPDVAPAYAGLLVDRLGSIWVEPYVIGDRPSVEWSVFDAEGVFVATVRMPGHFRPTEIGGGYILGVSTDEMDVERVHRYALYR